MNVNAINRAVLSILGLLLVAVGGLGLAVGAGAFGSDRATRPVLHQSVRGYPDTHAWFWWAVAGACLLIALLALWWLLIQLHSDRTTRIDRTTDARDGYTVVHAGALSDAAAEDARRISGVAGASAHVSERPQRLIMRVDLADHADIGAVRDRLEQDTVPNVRAALDEEALPVDIELRPSGSKKPGHAVA
jgi:hypothetical protein